MTTPTDDARRDRMLTFLTVEHSNLQSARSSTIFDANGRTTLYLTFVSSTLVGIAFIGQATQLTQPFFLVSLVLLPPVFFVGVVTFMRVLQSSVEDITYGRGINRIRHFYTELEPDAKPYFVQSIYDDGDSVVQNMAGTPGYLQQALTTAGMVGVVNSVLGAIIVGMLVGVFAPFPLAVVVGIGIVTAIVSVVTHFRYQAQMWARVDAAMPVRFPSPEAEAHSQKG